jgi:hypothetical protein
LLTAGSLFVANTGTILFQHFDDRFDVGFADAR